MADMPGTVEQVLRDASRPFTDATARAVDAFLADNPRGTHGLVDYRPQDLGLDPQQRREALAFYRARFNVPDG